MNDTYTCPKHNIAGLSSSCPSCMAEFNDRKSAIEMTSAERAATLKAIPDVLTIPFDSLHQWVTELMGRDAWTHEFAYPELLIQELERQQPASFAEVLGKIPPDKRVLIVGTDS